MSSYAPPELDQKWQRFWERSGLIRTPELPDKEKYYVLVMFAYPSGDIHMGHFRNYSIGDAVARYRMMCGKRVLHPFGWDAFGLPAEEAAIKKKMHPRDWTLGNIAVSKETLKRCGILFNWEREVTTCLPDYYKWTQWMFLLMYKRGLAYRGTGYVNWCPSCKTVLANEQAIDGVCWRCKSEVVKRELEQWYFRLTAYSERLLEGLKNLDWPEPIKTMQRNWIGRSEGTEVIFSSETGDEIKVFTTRADTLYGVTFLVLAPEHPLTLKLATGTSEEAKVRAYVEKALKEPEYLRTAEERPKEGVFIGRYAIHPLTKEKLPLFVADYVLYHYGTGAVMGVPAHDERDFQFAKKYNLPIKVVIKPINAEAPHTATMESAYVDYGIMVNSAEFSGLSSEEGIKRLNDSLKKRGLGSGKVTYRLRDWLISRQRYWGAPIPMVHCPKCGTVPVDETDLPVLLPEGKSDFIPKGRSPLADSPEFMNVKCPRCKGNAKRDPDTMDTFVCSSWYHLRYSDPKNEKEPFSREKVAAWLPADIYIGGAEHACGHLIYFRFFTKVLYDAGYLPFDEPALRLFNHGMVLDSKGEVMSKSKGNVVSPRELVEKEGADVARIAMFFAAPSDAEIRWNEETVTGARRFLTRVWTLFTERCLHIKDLNEKTTQEFDWRKLPDKQRFLWRKLHSTIKRCREQLEGKLAFNTAIAALMELLNELDASDIIKDKSNTGKSVLAKVLENLLLLLAPFAPHTAEELWEFIGNKPSIFENLYPVADEEAAKEEVVEIGIQVNGKIRDRITVAADTDEKIVKELALSSAKIKEAIKNRTIVKAVYVPNRLLNLVTC
jgi:leucyl-tRNA synthetase